MNKEKIQMELLENGLDFILTGIDYISKQKTNKHFKYGILNLSSGIELILKERLRNEHWSLLFEDINKANWQDFISGNFISVYHNKLTARLAGICNIIFSEKEKQAFDDLLEKRNRIEHFSLIDEKAAIIVTAAKALVVIISFINREFKVDNYGKKEKEALKKIRENLAYFQVFVDKRNKSIDAELQKLQIKIKCPVCKQNSVDPHNEFKCLFCGHKTNKNDIFAVFRQGDWLEMLGEVTHECPKCGRDEFFDSHNCVKTLHLNSGRYICFFCNNIWREEDVSKCMVCNKLFIGDGINDEICNNCLNGDSYSIFDYEDEEE